MTDDPDHPPSLAYAVRSEEVWTRAREDYLRGDSASTVCERHGLARSTFRGRAARDGWRRADQPDHVRTRHIAVIGDLNELTFFDFSQMAYMRLRDSLLTGRAGECEGWLRLHNALLSASFDHDPPTGWDLDRSDYLDRSRGDSGSSLTPGTRPPPETPAPPPSSPGPEPGSDAESGRSVR